MGYKFEDISAGMLAQREIVFTQNDLEAFSVLSKDRAPFHFDDALAVRAGFREKIVFGILVVSPFSSMLGMEIPGPNTVIQSLNFNFHRPIYTSEKLDYSVMVNKSSVSTKTIDLALMISLHDDKSIGALKVSGSARCGFLL